MVFEFYILYYLPFQFVISSQVIFYVFNLICISYSYVVLGKLIGRYYDSSGKETDYNKLVLEKIKSSKMAKVAKNKEMAKYPSCNVEYVQENQKSKVWCTTLRLDQ